MNATIEPGTKNQPATLVIRCPIAPAPSKSGKSVNLFTSGGNIPTSVTFDGKVVRIGVNAYVPAN